MTLKTILEYICFSVASPVHCQVSMYAYLGVMLHIAPIIVEKNKFIGIS